VGLIVIAGVQYNSLLNLVKTTPQENITIDEVLPIVRLCDQRRDKRVFGEVVGADELTQDGKSRARQLGNFRNVMRI
jgi:hypothetical protein